MPFASPMSASAPRPCAAAIRSSGGPITPASRQMSARFTSPRAMIGGAGMLPRVDGSSTKPSTPAVDRRAALRRLSPSGKVAARLVRSLRPRRAPSCRASAAGEWVSACSNRISMATTDGPAFAIGFDKARDGLARPRPRGNGVEAVRIDIDDDDARRRRRLVREARSRAKHNVAHRLDGTVEQALRNKQECGDQHGGRHDAAEQWRHRCQTSLNHLSFQRCGRGPPDRRTSGRMCGRSRPLPRGCRAPG